MSDTDKRPTVEDILGDFGYRLAWSVSDHWADVVVYEIVGRDENNKALFNNKEAVSEPDVESHAEAEPVLTGFVKWDGCSQFDMGNQHLCGADSFTKHIALLRHIYHRAFELMGREMYDEWVEK